MTCLAHKRKNPKPEFLTRQTQFIPSEPMYSPQWSHLVTSAQAAWVIERGNALVTVAIIDVGVDYSHEDLAASILAPCASGCPTGKGYDFVDIDTVGYKAAGYSLIPAEDYV